MGSTDCKVKPASITYALFSEQNRASVVWVARCGVCATNIGFNKTAFDVAMQRGWQCPVCTRRCANPRCRELFIDQPAKSLFHRQYCLECRVNIEYCAHEGCSMFVKPGVPMYANRFLYCKKHFLELSTPCTYIKNAGTKSEFRCNVRCFKQKLCPMHSRLRVAARKDALSPEGQPTAPPPLSLTD